MFETSPGIRYISMVRKYPLKAPTSLLCAKGFLSTEPVSARWLESWLGKEQLQSSSAFLSFLNFKLIAYIILALSQSQKTRNWGMRTICYRLSNLCRTNSFCEKMERPAWPWIASFIFWLFVEACQSIDQSKSNSVYLAHPWTGLASSWKLGTHPSSNSVRAMPSCSYLHLCPAGIVDQVVLVWAIQKAGYIRIATVVSEESHLEVSQVVGVPTVIINHPAIGAFPFMETPTWIQCLGFTAVSFSKSSHPTIRWHLCQPFPALILAGGEVEVADRPWESQLPPKIKVNFWWKAIHSPWIQKLMHNNFRDQEKTPWTVSTMLSF